MRVEIYPFSTGSSNTLLWTPEVIEWPANTRMTSDIFKFITGEMRFIKEFTEGADRVVTQVYNGLLNTVTLALDPDGTMHMISYHPGKMDAVMSICTVKRGGIHNA